MKISPCFAHPRGILDLCDTFLSDESNRSYIKNCSSSSKLYNGMGGCFCSTQSTRMFYIQAIHKIYSEKFFKIIWNAIKLFLKHLLHGLKNRLINNSHIRQNCVAENPLNFKVFKAEQHKNLKKYNRACFRLFLIFIF